MRFMSAHCLGKIPRTLSTGLRIAGCYMGDVTMTKVLSKTPAVYSAMSLSAVALAALTQPASANSYTGTGTTHVLYYDTKITVKDSGDLDGDYCVGDGSVFNEILMPDKKTVKWRLTNVEFCKSKSENSLEDLEGALITLEDNSATNVQVSSGGLQWAYGGLVVPYKLQLTGEQETHKAGATGALYVGGKLSWPASNVSVSAFGFGGAADVKLPIAGQETDVFAISYGAGINFGINSVSENFNLGVVVGFDHVDDNKNYEYNDKPWVGISLSVGK
jgi:hypothetical protein